MLYTLEEISKLGINWDGQGSDPISDSLIGRAFRVIPYLSKECKDAEPFPIAGPKGSQAIQFEWQLLGKTCSIDAELIIHEDSYDFYMEWEELDIDKEGNLTAKFTNPHQITQYVDRFWKKYIWLEYGRHEQA